MEPDDRQQAEPRDETDESKRNDALARYDAHPGVAVLLLAVMAFLFIVVVYQFASDRADNGVMGHDKRVLIETLNARDQ
jgi:hypothetical protein